MIPNLDVMPQTDANRLGLLYRQELHRLPFAGPMWDVHLHLNSPAACATYFAVADHVGVERGWAMVPQEVYEPIHERWGHRLEFIAVPSYSRRHHPETFTTRWMKQIEWFAEHGARVCKFWAAPRGRDLNPALRLDHPLRRESMRLARDCGMIFMSHVGDPDTWFQTHYADHRFYGHRREHYEPLEALLEEFHDVPWIGAHMSGNPEDLDYVQTLLDRFPNYYLDTSAAKWMIRELSQHADHFRDFCQRNPGRVLFGSDITVVDEGRDWDWYASRYWSLRVLMETDYDGPSPIVDPDLPLIDPTLPKTVTAHLVGANLDPTTLAGVYRAAAAKVLPAR